MADTTKPTTETPKETKTVESEIELAKKAFALRKFEDSVEHYATALELFTEKHGDGAPESADLLFLYGKALLENAISQAGVVGKEETEGALKGNKEDEAGPSSSKGGKKVISFSGDAEDDDEPVDLLGNAQNAEDGDEDQEEGEGEGGDEDEPEDDFNAAWEVIDLARALYAKQDGEEAQLKLADTYMSLGDVSLETEKFDQAIGDYSSGLHLKQKLLPVHSRQVAEAHYRLALAMDLTPGKLAGAIGHAEKALQSVDVRLSILKGKLEEAPAEQDAAMEDGSASADAKGKAKATGMIGSLANDNIDGLSKSQVEAQIKEFEELRGDLAAKVEDLRSAPEQPTGENGQITSVTEAANRALDEALNPGLSLAGASAPVNDLSGMVKKKKKAPAAEASGSGSGTPTTLDVSGKSTGKRKADDEEMADGATTPVEKKVKLAEDAESAA